MMLSMRMYFDVALTINKRKIDTFMQNSSRKRSLPPFLQTNRGDKSPSLIYVVEYVILIKSQNVGMPPVAALRE